MKNSKIFLVIVLALILTICFSTIPYANTNEFVANHNVKQLPIEKTTRGAKCPKCGSFNFNIYNTVYSKWVYTDEMTSCTTHTQCAIKKWSRIKMVTHMCSNCSYGFSVTTPEYEYKHCSTN